MDWFDIGGTGRVNVITEQEYRGIMCKYVDGKGWKIIVGSEEYIFPHYQAARSAIDNMHKRFKEESL